jgi:hypothetical protein
MLWAWAFAASADQVEMLNGDRYVGRVLSLGSDTLTVQSDVLGTLRLPRGRISTITLDSKATEGPVSAARPMTTSRTNTVARARVGVGTSTNVSPEFSAAMKDLGANSNLIQQVQQQLLGGAGPEAQAKFNDLVSGLLSGKMGVNDLRSEAKTTLEQARKARKDMGEEGGSMMDSYLAILDSFLKETEPTMAPTNAAAVAVKPKVPTSIDDE